VIVGEDAYGFTLPGGGSPARRRDRTRTGAGAPRPLHDAREARWDTTWLSFVFDTFLTIFIVLPFLERAATRANDRTDAPVRSASFAWRHSTRRNRLSFGRPERHGSADNAIWNNAVAILMNYARRNPITSLTQSLASGPANLIHVIAGGESRLPRK
jgi:hypothetical protein